MIRQSLLQSFIFEATKDLEKWVWMFFKIQSPHQLGNHDKIAIYVILLV